MTEVVPAWRHAVEAGQPFDAIKAYMEEGGDDEQIDLSLRALADIQHELRGKRFKRAKKALGRVEDMSLTDCEQLGRELEILEKSARELEQIEPEAALGLLDGVEHALLQAEASTQRGTAHIYLDKHENAREQFELALALDARHYRAMTNLGNLELEAGHLDNAIAAYEQALKIKEDFPNALHNLGVAYRRKGDLHKSVQKIKAAQRASRQQDAEDARASISTGGRSQAKWVRWLLYGAIGAAIYYVLRSQGII